MPRLKIATDDWGCLIVKLDNPPLPRPGVYLLTHIATGMAYVGATRNIRRRFLEWSRGDGNVSQVNQVSGRGAFLAQPLYYTLQMDIPRKGLLTAIEDALIETWDGYLGLNRPRADVATLAALPEAKAKRSAIDRTPEAKARRTATMNRYWAARAIRVEINGKVMTLRQWAIDLDMRYVTLYWRYQNDKTLFPFPYRIVT